MASTIEELSERLSSIRAGIAGVTERPVAIVAVTKSRPASDLEDVVAAGVDIIGENYAQELREKAPTIERLRAAGTEVHFIGQLQTNKVRLVAPLVDVVQSVDRMSLVEELARRAPGMRVFIQVDTSQSSGRGGCPPSEVEALVDAAQIAGLRVEGLMTVGPADGDTETSRCAFGLVTTLADRLGLPVRSMGMTDDHLLAVAEGSTMVRIGTALLGPRG